MVGGLCPCATSFCLFYLMGGCLDAFLSLSFFSSSINMCVCIYVFPLFPLPFSYPSFFLSSFLSFLLMMLMILEPRHQRTHVDLGWVDVVLRFYNFFSIFFGCIEHGALVGTGLRHKVRKESIRRWVGVDKDKMIKRKKARERERGFGKGNGIDMMFGQVFTQHWFLGRKNSGCLLSCLEGKTNTE